MSLIQKIASQSQVKAALNNFHDDVERLIQSAIAIQKIPAPTFSESKRAKYIERCLVETGLHDVGHDKIHNVFGRWPGHGDGGPVIISAHTDTVFPAGTDLTVNFENDQDPSQGIIHGPGLADNSVGVAGILGLAQAMDRFELKTAADIWFVANVCEEGLGDLRGMRAVVERFGDRATYLVVEGGSFGHIFHQAIGVRRFRLEVTTPGGHSWGDYGMASAVHVLGRLITALDDIPLPAEPRTSLNVGVVEGGTTVNTIAASASCLIDMRSVDPAVLEGLVEVVEDLVDKTNSLPDVTVTMTQIGNRPAGILPRDEPPVAWAADALRQVGCQKITYLAGSTDANVPLSLGLPSVCIGLARSVNTHRLDEYLDPAELPRGMGQLLLLTLAAAGFIEP